MAKCTYCGEKLPREDARFCTHCGMLVPSHPFSPQSLAGPRRPFDDGELSGRKNSSSRQLAGEVAESSTATLHGKQPDKLTPVPLTPLFPEDEEPTATLSEPLEEPDLDVDALPTNHIPSMEAEAKPKSVSSITYSTDIEFQATRQMPRLAENNADLESIDTVHMPVSQLQNSPEQGVPSTPWIEERQFEVSHQPFDEFPSWPDEDAANNQPHAFSAVSSNGSGDEFRHSQPFFPPPSSSGSGPRPFQPSFSGIEDDPRQFGSSGSGPQPFQPAYGSQGSGPQPFQTPVLPVSPTPQSYRAPEPVAPKRRSGPLPAVLISVFLLLLVAGGIGAWVVLAEPFKVAAITQPRVSFSDSTLGFTLSYPNGWQTQTERDKSIAHFSDSSHTTRVDITGVDGAGKTLDQVIQQFLKDQNISGEKAGAKVTFGGTEWQQTTGPIVLNGANYTFTIFVTQHGNRIVTLVQYAPQSTYADSEQLIFKALRDSFRFV